MTRSLTKELFIPFREPKLEFRTSRKLFKTLSLDESRSPEFNLFSNLEEYFEEEVAETMAETMEHSDHEDANEHIEKVLEIEVILFYNELDVQTRQIINSKGAIPSKIDVDAKVPIQEMADTLKNGTIEHLGHEVLKLLTDWKPYKHNFIILEEKSRRKITLRVEDEKIIFKSVKPASSLIKRVYYNSNFLSYQLDLEARLMGETLVLNRSLEPLYRDYIELNDLNVPLELKRDQVDDLMPTIEKVR
nr:hypothetical protein [Tanacetum cinerariifolium]